jgi:hypothetical protein
VYRLHLNSIQHRTIKRFRWFLSEELLRKDIWYNFCDDSSARTRMCKQGLEERKKFVITFKNDLCIIWNIFIQKLLFFKFNLSPRLWVKLIIIFKDLTLLKRVQLFPGLDIQKRFAILPHTLLYYFSGNVRHKIKCILNSI